jgi:Tol biopolymer transport system component
MNPDWSPDGKKIAYDVFDEGAIYIMKIRWWFEKMWLWEYEKMTNNLTIKQRMTIVRRTPSENDNPMTINDKISNKEKQWEFYTL